MNIYNQVCTRVQALELKSLGIEADSLFWWYQDYTPTNPNLHYYGYKQEDMPWEIKFGYRPSHISTSNVFFEASAFTGAELRVLLPEWLPHRLGDSNMDYRLKEWHNVKEQFGKDWKMYEPFGYCLCYENQEIRSKNRIGLANPAYGPEPQFTTEAIARATMLIHLLQKGLITAGEANHRLKQTV